jgi:cytochrome c peroxidase
VRRLLLTALFAAAAGTAAAAGDPPFERPAAIPYPAANAYAPEKLALGERLFFDPRLSRSGAISCGTCHRPEHGFAEPLAKGVGEAGSPLPRHTPTLWGLAWGRAFFWDGRAQTLEEQAHGPLTSPGEMAMDAATLDARLAADPGMRIAFAESFPEDPRPTTDNALKAIATYVRALVPAANRVDAWAAGDASALSQAERDGAALFYGKAKCASCHSGPWFTDGAFHDIGLPDADAGRGKVLAMPALDHAFKTPSLRGIASSAPYMHDGSLADLDTVVKHYETGMVKRPTLSRELPTLALSTEERAALVAFLKALGEGDGTLDPLPPDMAGDPLPPAVATDTVSQRNRAFAPGRVALGAGAALTIANDDTVDHTIRIRDGGLDFASGLMRPDDKVEVTFPKTGRYHAFCGIHPQMELVIDVE